MISMQRRRQQSRGKTGVLRDGSWSPGAIQAFRGKKRPGFYEIALHFLCQLLWISVVLLCVTQLKNKGCRHLCQHVRAATHTHTTHTHTHLHTLCPALLRWAGARKVKPIWILLKQVAVASAGPYASLHLAPDNHASTPTLRVFTDRMPFLPPRPRNTGCPGKYGTVGNPSHSPWHSV